MGAHCQGSLPSHPFSKEVGRCSLHPQPPVPSHFIFPPCPQVPWGDPHHQLPSRAPGLFPCGLFTAQDWCRKADLYWKSGEEKKQRGPPRTASLCRGLTHLCSLHFSEAPYPGQADLSDSKVYGQGSNPLVCGIPLQSKQTQGCPLGGQQPETLCSFPGQLRHLPSRKCPCWAGGNTIGQTRHCCGLMSAPKAGSLCAGHNPANYMYIWQGGTVFTNSYSYLIWKNIIETVFYCIHCVGDNIKLFRT